MKLSLKICLLFLLPLFAKSQPIQKLDSLHHVLKTAENDSVRMDVLEDFYKYYAESNVDSALFFTEQGLAISKKINQPLWTARSLINKGYLLLKKENLSLSFKLFNESIAISKEAKSEKNVYFPESLKADWDPHKLRLHLLGGGYHNLGNTYRHAGNAEKAISSFKEVFRIVGENDRGSSFVHASMNIGSIYLDLNRLDSAMLYTRNAINFSNNSSFKTYLGNMLRVMGDIYSRQKQPDSAKYYYRKSLIVSREQGNVTSEIAANIALSKLNERIAQTDSMLFYANAAFRMASGLKVGAQIVSSSELISSAFKRKGYLDSALTYLTISKRMADSLNKVRTEKLTEFQNIGFEEQMRLEKAAQESVAYKNKIQTISLFSGLALLSVLAFVFFRNNRQKQKANLVLQNTLSELKATQSQLIQAEKMASLGELTAGIAHEIQNPLNFVNNFSEVSKELIDEVKSERSKVKSERDEALEEELLNDIAKNLEKINHHGKRADAIVKGMLQHSRTSTGQKELTDINALCDEYLRLAYHGLKAKDPSFNASFHFEPDNSLPKINVVPQDIGRVLLNLINNAFQAVSERKKIEGENFNPEVKVSTKLIFPPAGFPSEEKGRNEVRRGAGGSWVAISVSDNGPGIPDSIKSKIFQPFFTTKPTGQGTGLGLSLSYDIVKAHGGELSLGTPLEKEDTVENEGTTFTIIIPFG